MFVDAPCIQSVIPLRRVRVQSLPLDTSYLNLTTGIAAEATVPKKTINEQDLRPASSTEQPWSQTDGC